MKNLFNSLFLKPQSIYELVEVKELNEMVLKQQILVCEHIEILKEIEKDYGVRIEESKKAHEIIKSLLNT